MIINTGVIHDNNTFRERPRVRSRENVTRNQRFETVGVIRALEYIHNDITILYKRRKNTPSFRLNINPPSPTRIVSRWPAKTSIRRTSTTDSFVKKNNLIGEISTDYIYPSHTQIHFLRVIDWFHPFIYQAYSFEGSAHRTALDLKVKFILNEDDNLVEIDLKIIVDEVRYRFFVFNGEGTRTILYI